MNDLLARAVLGPASAWMLAMAGTPAAAAPSSTPPDLQGLQAMTARYAPVDIRVDLSQLPDNERQSLVRMIQAAQIVDALYLRQVSALNESRLLSLLNDRTPLGEARLRYFLLNKGPWSELDEDRPFLPGVPAKPAQANYYPADTTRSEVEAWMNSLPGNEREVAAGFFSVIRRDARGKLTAVPYSIEYQEELREMARLLREAAALTAQPTLKAFLEKRAGAFLSNDYHESDVAWLDLQASIDPTIGPYESYLDQWFNFKAAFEAYIGLTDAQETAKLERFGHELQELEDHLPIDPQYRRPKLGAQAPIRVVNVVYTAGDGNHGSPAAAYNLPNDERTVSEKGSKRILLRNFQQAKFERVLTPIADIVLSPADRPFVAFDSFFTHILMHELMHGLGPQNIRVDGRDTTVRLELKELYGPLEEAKADISGLWALQYLMDKGVLDKKQERSVYTTFLASTFRTLRFGLGEAHARGMALQVNTLFDHGAVRVAADGTFSLDIPKTKKAVVDLTHQIMTLEARGDYAGTEALLRKMVTIRPQVQRALDRLNAVPVDIAPRLLTGEELVRGE
jgi:hypothetical protein